MFDWVPSNPWLTTLSQGHKPWLSSWTSHKYWHLVEELPEYEPWNNLTQGPSRDFEIAFFFQAYRCVSVMIWVWSVIWSLIEGTFTAHHHVRPPEGQHLNLLLVIYHLLNLNWSFQHADDAQIIFKFLQRLLMWCTIAWQVVCSYLAYKLCSCTQKGTSPPSRLNIWNMFTQGVSYLSSSILK